MCYRSIRGERERLVRERKRARYRMKQCEKKIPIEVLDRSNHSIYVHYMGPAGQVFDA